MHFVLYCQCRFPFRFVHIEQFNCSIHFFDLWHCHTMAHTRTRRLFRFVLVFFLIWNIFIQLVSVNYFSHSQYSHRRRQAVILHRESETCTNPRNYYLNEQLFFSDLFIYFQHVDTSNTGWHCIRLVLMLINGRIQAIELKWILVGSFSWRKIRIFLIEVLIYCWWVVILSWISLKPDIFGVKLKC